MGTIGKLSGVAMIVAVVASPVIAQETPQDEVTRFQRERMEQQIQKLLQLPSPDLTQLIELATYASQRIYGGAGRSDDLRTMSKRLDQKREEIAKSDLGRYIATQRPLVSTFLSMDADTTQISEQALVVRYQRLKKAIEVLSDYKESTQGRLETSTHPAAETIREDAQWVNDTYAKVQNRLSIIGAAEDSFNPSVDWSSYPTLQQAKHKMLQEAAMIVSERGLEGRDRAVQQAASDREKMEFTATRDRFETETKGLRELHALSRIAMEKEFGVRAEQEKQRIAQIENQQRDVELQTQLQNQESEQDRIKQYIESTRVQQLLTPFCTDGFVHAGSGLERGPMSLKKIAENHGYPDGALSPTRHGLAGFVRCAQQGNDRASWGVDERTAYMLPPRFTDIDGNKVNPVVEAQRIIREHGQLLIELGMLQP